MFRKRSQDHLSLTVLRLIRPRPRPHPCCSSAAASRITTGSLCCVAGDDVCVDDKAWYGSSERELWGPETAQVCHWCSDKVRLVKSGAFVCSLLLTIEHLHCTEKFQLCSWAHCSYWMESVGHHHHHHHHFYLPIISTIIQVNNKNCEAARTDKIPTRLATFCHVSKNNCTILFLQ